MKMKMKIAIILDAICWFGSTGIALYFNYPIVAALLGSAGVMMLYKSIQVYYRVLELMENQNDA